MVAELIADATVLAVFPLLEDHISLDKILSGSTWKVLFTRTLAEARAALDACLFGAVLSEVRFADGHCWRDLLCEMQSMTRPPPLIVADRLADERLWAEVLNLGAYDLLAKPFEAKEVLHAVSTACQRCEREQRNAAPPTPMRSAERIGTSGTKVRTAYSR
jgi:DNA-binding NtrC family response regulator